VSSLSSASNRCAIPTSRSCPSSSNSATSPAEHGTTGNDWKVRTLPVGTGQHCLALLRLQKTPDLTIDLPTTAGTLATWRIGYFGPESGAFNPRIPATASMQTWRCLSELRPQRCVVGGRRARAGPAGHCPRRPLQPPAPEMRVDVGDPAVDYADIDEAVGGR
jgi:hypothetical protein